MTYQPENLERWKRPEHFAAWTRDWFYSDKAFCFLGRHRDSGILEESNFDCALKAIGGESETVQIIRESHWAVGWIEWIAIHESDATALQIADEIAGALSDYPVVDESDWSERECDAANDYWAQCSISERMEMCKSDGISVFAARRDYIPQGDSGRIFEQCLGY